MGGNNTARRNQETLTHTVKSDVFTGVMETPRGCASVFDFSPRWHWHLPWGNVVWAWAAVEPFGSVCAQHSVGIGT